MIKTSAIIMIKRFFRSPEKIFRAVDVQLLVKLTVSSIIHAVIYDLRTSLKLTH